MMTFWQIKDQKMPIGQRTLIMGILNITPDSFSDGGQFFDFDSALAHAEQMIADGADIIDVGGESTRPGGDPVSAEDEIKRVVPVIEALAKRVETPVSVDTTKSEVARAALGAGASMVNDISALRFDYFVADEAAKVGAGLVLMHSRGTPATMHRLPPVADIMSEVTNSLRASVHMAERRGVKRESIVIDPGIGFGKSQEQNLELIAKLDQLIAAFPDIPLLIGTSRKSFIGRILADDSGTPAPSEDRLHGTMATIAAAVLRGAHIVRVHDVKAAEETIRVSEKVKSQEDLSRKGAKAQS
jgi:dihydropteroate synthase